MDTSVSPQPQAYSSLPSCPLVTNRSCAFHRVSILWCGLGSTASPHYSRATSLMTDIETRKVLGWATAYSGA